MQSEETKILNKMFRYEAKIRSLEMNLVRARDFINGNLPSIYTKAVVLEQIERVLAFDKDYDSPEEPTSNYQEGELKKVKNGISLLERKEPSVPPKITRRA